MLFVPWKSRCTWEAELEVLGRMVLCAFEQICRAASKCTLRFSQRFNRLQRIYATYVLPTSRLCASGIGNTAKRTLIGLFLVIRLTALCCTLASVTSRTKVGAVGTLHAGRLNVTTPMFPATSAPAPATRLDVGLPQTTRLLGPKLGFSLGF